MDEVEKWIAFFEERHVREMKRAELIRLYRERYDVEYSVANRRLRKLEYFKSDLIEAYGETWDRDALVYFFKDKITHATIWWTGRRPFSFEL